jgi:hypothetical protein
MEWINVNDQLPPDQGTGESIYLALWIEGVMDEEPYWVQGRYDHVKGYFHTMETVVEDSIHYERLSNVSKWAIVPEPPKI